MHFVLPFNLNTDINKLTVYIDIFLGLEQKLSYEVGILTAFIKSGSKKIPQNFSICEVRLNLMTNMVFQASS